MTTGKFLESRGWRWQRGAWNKRGWHFVLLESAKVCEDYYERTRGAVTPREEATVTELAELDRLIRHK